MNFLGYSILPRAKLTLLRETYSKSKVILQRFSNTSDDIKNEEEKDCKNNDFIPMVNLENKNIDSILREVGEGTEDKWKITRENFDSDENLHGFEPILPGPLDECKEDVSHIGPYCRPSFNLAAYADRSLTLQKLCDLGVNLYKIEMKPANAKYIMTLDFEKDIKPYIQFFYDCGIPPEEFKSIITENPKIFTQDLDDLKTRIRYLRAHAFNKSMVARIISYNPFWLMFSTKRIDGRLGYFQTEFKLLGSQVRKLTVKQPRLITYNMEHIRECVFAVKEEMGFSNTEIKSILLKRPILWMYNRMRIVSSFDYVHNTMKIPHKLLMKEPDILLHRKSRIDQRHRFLVELKKAQYDPQKPLYISPKTLVTGTDAEFCLYVAKVPVETYNLFLKTL